ncbi:MAG: hypothetical protein NTY28_04365, partial [Janthinobacterium sp.]|nr:hypothetical protein [Janthinobacterium sp.]
LKKLSSAMLVFVTVWLLVFPEKFGENCACVFHRGAVLPGQTMQLSFNLSKAALFDPANGERIA